MNPLRWPFSGMMTTQISVQLQVKAKEAGAS